MSASNYLENKILDHTLGTTTFAKPATVYAALFTSDPGEAGGGAEVSSAGGSAYARQAAAFAAAANGQALNSGVISFPKATAAWGTLTHWALFDAATAGNLLYKGLIEKAGAPAPLVIAADDQAVIDVGGLAVNAD